MLQEFLTHLNLSNSRSRILKSIFLNDNETIQNLNLYDNNTIPMLLKLENINEEDHFLNRTSTQLLLILAYTFVFCCCFFGEFLSFILYYKLSFIIIFLLL